MNVYFLFCRNYCGTATINFNLFEELLFVLCTVSILNLLILWLKTNLILPSSLLTTEAPERRSTGSILQELHVLKILWVCRPKGVPSSGVAGNNYMEGLNNLSLETPDKVFPAEVSAAEAPKGPVDMRRKMITALRKLLIAMKRLCADLDNCSSGSTFAYLSIGLKDTRMAYYSFPADLNTINDAEALKELTLNLADMFERCVKS